MPATGVAAQLVCATSIYPCTLTEPIEGMSVDLIDGDGPVLAVLVVGSLSAGATLLLAAEESDTGQTWTAVAGFAPAAATLGTNLARLSRTKRYVRLLLNCAVGIDASASATLVTRRKLTP